MTNALKARLREIQGKTSFFKAAGIREKDLSDFQSVVYELEELFKGGYLEAFVPHKESQTGHGWIDAVCVGKLTAKGEALLED